MKQDFAKPAPSRELTVDRLIEAIRAQLNSQPFTVMVIARGMGRVQEQRVDAETIPVSWPLLDSDVMIIGLPPVDVSPEDRYQEIKVVNTNWIEPAERLVSSGASPA